MNNTKYSKRVYKAPAMLNASRFERRGILAACCLTSETCAAASMVEIEVGSDQGICEGGTKSGQNIGASGSAQSSS